MTFKITLDRKTQRLLKEINSKEGLVASVHDEFFKRGPIKVKQAIIQDMIKGVSPVKGKRWAKYSQSYKDVIDGKAMFRVNKKTGKLFVVSIKDFSRKAKRNIKQKILDHRPKEFRGKRKSPVNLRLSGALHRSLKVFRGISALGNKTAIMVVEFRHFLAEIHDKKGAGKSKVVRRMLPRGGESFNRNISIRVFSELQKAVDKVAKSLS